MSARLPKPMCQAPSTVWNLLTAWPAGSFLCDLRLNARKLWQWRHRGFTGTMPTTLPALTVFPPDKWLEQFWQRTEENHIRVTHVYSANVRTWAYAVLPVWRYVTFRTSVHVAYIQSNEYGLTERPKLNPSKPVVTICTAQWSLYVPHSGHYMYRTVVTVCTAQWSLYVPHSCHYTYRQFNIQQFHVLPTHTVFMCFVWISEQTAIISQYNINWLVFITETECVYCAVRTGSLCIVWIASWWTCRQFTNATAGCTLYPVPL